MKSTIDFAIFGGTLTLRDSVEKVGMLFSDRFWWILLPWPVAFVLLLALVGVISVCLRLLNALALSNLIESSL